jgi:hypothetical protein
MTATARPSKLAELRTKTDRQLVSIIDNALKNGLLLACCIAERRISTRIRRCWLRWLRMRQNSGRWNGSSRNFARILIDPPTRGWPVTIVVT